MAHVLPVLFPFTTPGKYCHRAIASFCKHVTGTQREPLSFADHSTSPTPPIKTSMPQVIPPEVQVSRIQRAANSVKRHSWWSRPSAQVTSEPTLPSGNKTDHTSGEVTSRLRDHPSDASADVAGPRTGGTSEPRTESVPKAGEALVYAGDWVITIHRARERHFLHIYFRRLTPPSTEI